MHLNNVSVCPLSIFLRSFHSQETARVAILAGKSLNPPRDPKERGLSQAGRGAGSLEANRVSETDRCTKHPPLASKKPRGTAASRGPPRLPSALSPRLLLSLPPTCRFSHPAQPGLVVTWLPSAEPRSHHPATRAHSCPLRATVLHGRPRRPLPQQA